MGEKTEKKRLAILRILQETDRPLGSAKITERLLADHHEISERTVRYYLSLMDKEGMTKNMGKKGRRISQRGLDELGSARILDRVGYLAAKIDQMTYRMNFDLATKTGTVVVNVSIVNKKELKAAAPYITKILEVGYGMGKLISLLPPGERIGEMTIQEGELGLATVCSITLNGVLLAHGIPTNSSFGGLLELKDHKPTRFVEIIHYNGTTLDPLEIFIRSAMTDYHGAIDTGNGRIGASFRELPAASRDKVVELAYQLEKIGLGGFMTIGWPGQPLLEIPVNQGQIGAIVFGGLNPVAILEERGIKSYSRALSGLADYQSFFPYNELEKRLREFD